MTITPTDDLQTSLGSQPDIERLYDNVTLILPAVTLSLIKVAAWNTIEEFAIKSTYFRDLVQWSMPIGVSTVNFNPYSGDMMVCWVLAQYGLYQWMVDPPAQLRDLREPMTARTGTALVALKPVSFDSTLPPEMFSTWFECLLDGTLFRLAGMPSKPWSDPKSAIYHGTRFRGGINRARDTATRNWSNQQGPWRYPLCATGRRKQ